MSNVDGVIYDQGVLYVNMPGNVNEHGIPGVYRKTVIGLQDLNATLEDEEPP
ncbi:hypothetical protein BD309DRAFT_859381 [Dichomitus squalens]|uniref:Uncharacterized protein n=2 Tax=Dichomitus squalens TaxID=114155 RepID=A0A4Q9NVM5_9APHY|nr:uncharacterized protein DICSQDRAFT_170609 [Dichomitus squalens LYAD-421 SS1]EJF61060.1 hypothetical protein DICSQDRAFT_170609 [Dichomitus squalens LYAD-421 SS1]TBU27056.1 hypothetical protein BD311DRAFT_808002 [Dichomitus squalens]TBU45830.1 hypothetical protein BD309DRAFT_859381 [Dichomitus squalens]TBU56581.1 hypothetical protein BD310DRAFT_978772 [Dichomitus squalens]